MEEQLSVSLGLDCPWGHGKGGVKRNNRRVFGLNQRFTKQALMCVFLLTSNKYLLSTYYGPALYQAPNRQDKNTVPMKFIEQVLMRTIKQHKGE